MIAIDTSAIVAILRLEPEAASFVDAVSESDRCLVSAVSSLEAAMVLARSIGDPAAWEPLDEMLASPGMEVVPFDAAQVARAREAFLRYGKGRHPAGLNFGDCAAYALAATRGVPLLFKGDDFAKTDLAPVL
ncbi:MAG: type II toxin-antitoxin system VapC family toxin [Thalassobaculum sp.]|uniref:type II toxin-antitoxin system VapC family toxin n=1 Tax=Thalassobaculum sp. TaxID=2022740 RepID=UPI0032EEE184